MADSYQTGGDSGWNLMPQPFRPVAVGCGGKGGFLFCLPIVFRAL